MATRGLAHLLVATYLAWGVSVASCAGVESDFAVPQHVGHDFLTSMARGHISDAFYSSCQGRSENAPEVRLDDAVSSSPLAPDVGGRPADIVNDNPFGEPDPDGDVTLEGTVEDVPYVVVLTQFDDGLWCVTEATLDDDPIVTDGMMPLEQFP